MANFGHNNLKNAHRNSLYVWTGSTLTQKTKRILPETNLGAFVKRDSSLKRWNNTDWADIGAKIMTEFDIRNITDLLQGKLNQLKIAVLIHVKSYPDVKEVWVVYPKEPDYKTELKICEAFAQVEDSFAGETLELIMMKESDFQALGEHC